MQDSNQVEAKKIPKKTKNDAKFGLFSVAISNLAWTRLLTLEKTSMPPHPATNTSYCMTTNEQITGTWASIK